MGFVLFHIEFVRIWIQIPLQLAKTLIRIRQRLDKAIFIEIDCLHIFIKCFSVANAVFLEALHDLIDRPALRESQFLRFHCFGRVLDRVEHPLHAHLLV